MNTWTSLNGPKTMACLIAAVAQTLWAQPVLPPEAPDVGPMLTLQAPAGETLNKIGINYRMGLNVTIHFNRLGGLALSDPGPLLGNHVNRNYDDGYNRVDVTGNNHGGFIGTWYWSYSSPNSFQGDHLVLQSYSTPANLSTTVRPDDPNNGVELTYSRQFLRGKAWRAGLEGGLGYMRISASDNRLLRNTAYRTDDTYYGPGVEVWPLPPGPATFQGPGATINSAPTSRTVTALPNAALITGDRHLDADLYTLRLGPYFEVPLSERFALTFSGGLALALADSQFSFQENVTITDPQYVSVTLPHPRSGSGSQMDVLVGGYVGASLSYAVTERLNLVAGAQFQADGQAVSNRGGKQAVLDLSRSIIVSLGATFSF
jgi:hypothetical protein